MLSVSTTTSFGESAVCNVIVAPLRPVINPSAFMVCAAATPHNNRRIANDDVAVNTNVLLFIFLLLNVLPGFAASFVLPIHFPEMLVI